MFFAESLARLRALPEHDLSSIQVASAQLGGAIDLSRRLGVIDDQGAQLWGLRLARALHREAIVSPNNTKVDSPQREAQRLTHSPYELNLNSEAGNLKVTRVEIKSDGITFDWDCDEIPPLASIFPSEVSALEEDIATLPLDAASEVRQTAFDLLRNMRLFVFQLQDAAGTEYRIRNHRHTFHPPLLANGTTQFVPPPNAGTDAVIVKWFNASGEIRFSGPV